MEFSFEVVRLWERPAEELLRADLGVVPLAVLGRLPENLSLEDGLTVIAQRVVDRVTKEATADRVRKLLTDAFLLHLFFFAELTTMQGGWTFEDWRALIQTRPDVVKDVWHDPNAPYAEARQHNSLLQMAIVMSGMLSRSDDERERVVRLPRANWVGATVGPTCFRGLLLLGLMIRLGLAPKAWHPQSFLRFLLFALQFLHPVADVAVGALDPDVRF
jgi:hypothetical protein